MSKLLDLERALIDEIAKHGVLDYELVNGGKHKKLCFAFNGQSIKFIYPASPSDRRGIQNSLTDLRKAMGVKRVVRKSTAPRKPTRKKAARLTDCPVLTTRPDPFAALAGRIPPPKPSMWQWVKAIFSKGDQP